MDNLIFLQTQQAEIDGCCTVFGRFGAQVEKTTLHRTAEATAQTRVQSRSDGFGERFFVSLISFFPHLGADHPCFGGSVDTITK